MADLVLTGGTRNKIKSCFNRSRLNETIPAINGIVKAVQFSLGFFVFLICRKQVTPSRLNKSPKYDHATLNEQSAAQVGFDGQSNHLGECSSPASTVDSGVPSPGKLVLPNGGLRRNEKERLCNSDVEKISDNSQGNLVGEGGQSKDDLLVFTSGSGMVGFTPHPLDE